MKQILSLTVLFFTSIICFSQVVQTTDIRRINDNNEVNKISGKYIPAQISKIYTEWSWNTFMGSSGEDRGRCIALDGRGNVYITGFGKGTWGSPVVDPAGWIDAFVAKLDSSGALVWNTFLGGSTYDDYGKSIAVDSDGNIYVVGESDASWGTPVNTYAGGSFDVFVAKLNSEGVLQWNTFLGSSLTDYGECVTVDINGNIYVTGWSQATWGSPINAYTGDKDGFAAKLNKSGVLEWNTFMGSSRSDESNSIAVNDDGIYVAGMSRQSWGNSPVNAYTGSTDGFAAKLNGDGALVWNTFMGGSRSDESKSIAVDGSGNVYVAGTSEEDTWGLPVNDNSGWDEAFAVKLNSSGTLLWNTFLGSSDNDEGRSIAVDLDGNVYVGGMSKATWSSPINEFTGSGFEDAFAVKLNSSGMMQWNTFMGASKSDYGNSIAVDNNGYVYVSGTTYLYSWGSPINEHAGWGYDAFAVKFDYSDVVRVDIDSDLPNEYKLLQNYPNPFNPSTKIRYSIPQFSNVVIKVYDILGKEIATLVNEEKPVGNYELNWYAENLPSGVYFFQLKTGDFVETKKMILLK